MTEALTIPPLHCPAPLRDDRSLADEVDDRLVAWAEEIGAYGGHLGRLRDCEFGRLAMLTHPDCDDPDRLLTAAQCALAEWSIDDFYQDGDASDADPRRIGLNLTTAHAVLDPIHLPEPYQSQFEQVVRKDTVLVALRSAFDRLAGHGTWAQVFRLRYELTMMFVAYSQEAEWRISGRIPPVWEFLMHRQENSFFPCMVITDAVGGYEVPFSEYAQPQVRRLCVLAGTASVLVNDLYSMEKETRTHGFDFCLPKVIEAEEGCTLQEAVDRTAHHHDQLMRTFEAEAATLADSASPQLRRFLDGVWAWTAGGKEWHATSRRYHGPASE
ncbi:family 2 encapsulin nanocompartment cargo protein terpene cyclase [Streptomyces sp. CA-250714]|uniref:family 2 encapsulin nanocompartment cargo protein terpene cyclase n=1 Tax=Streptomyces sp. CA-250714 TaxID=3240060 RepID=UPI003D92EAD2